jgi:hypothetical protein
MLPDGQYRGRERERERRERKKKEASCGWLASPYQRSHLSQKGKAEKEATRERNMSNN